MYVFVLFFPTSFFLVCVGGCRMYMRVNIRMQRKGQTGKNSQLQRRSQTGESEGRHQRGGPRMLPRRRTTSPRAKSCLCKDHYRRHITLTGRSGLLLGARNHNQPREGDRGAQVGLAKPKVGNYLHASAILLLLEPLDGQYLVTSRR